MLWGSVLPPPPKVTLGIVPVKKDSRIMLNVGRNASEKKEKQSCLLFEMVAMPGGVCGGFPVGCYELGWLVRGHRSPASLSNPRPRCQMP